MRLLDDERGQSVQVGAAILLGFVVIAITMYQVEVVADQNAEVEFEHSQDIQGQLVDLRNDVTGIAGGGSSSSQTLQLGTSYPPRTIFLNPSQPRGVLRTTPTGQLRLQNVTATGEPDAVEDVWDSTTWTRSTRGITYRPSYHEYDGAPTTILEHGHLYNHHPNGVNRSVTDQLLVDGTSLTLLSLRGNLSESTSGTVSVRSRAFSTSQNTVSVRSTSASPLTITLPTRSPEYWESVLASESAVNQSTIVVDRSTTPNTITFELRPDTYSLQMAEIGVGDARQADPADRSEYIVPIDRTAPTAVVEVRDSLNNPVQNVEVRVTGTGISNRDLSTGSDGHVDIGSLSGGENITVRVVGDSGVSNSFRVDSGGSTGGGAYRVNWTSSPGSRQITNGNSNVMLSMETIPSAHGATVEYAVSDVGLIDGNSLPSGRTNDTGQHSTNIPINTTELDNRGGNATLRVYTSSGGSSDWIDVELTQPSGPTPQAELRVEDMSTSSSGPRYYASYELENLGSDYQRTAIRFEGPNPWQSTWINSTDQRGTVSNSPGGYGDEFTVTVYALDSNDDVLASRSIIDPSANGRNPSDNDDLGTASSPQITDHRIRDQSNNNVGYRFDWTADTTDFGEIELNLVGLNTGANARTTGLPASGNNEELSTYGNGNQFKTQILLYDADGVIVDSVVWIDTADGNGQDESP